MEFLNYDFVQRGILTGLLIGASSAVVGVFLILRRMAFLGAGLSHAAFGGIALSMIIDVEPFLLTALFTVTVGNLIQLISSKRKVPADAVIALFFSAGVALAVILLGISKKLSENVFGYLFGNILMVTEKELIISLAVASFVALFVVFFYRNLILLTFNEEIAKLRGAHINLINHLLISVASLTVVVSIKAVGIILSSSMLVIPALIGLITGKSFRSCLFISMAVSFFSVLVGIFISLYYNLPPSGSIVGIMVFLFAITFVKKILK